jgi:ubiquitin-protein ligase
MSEADRKVKDKDKDKYNLIENDKTYDLEYKGNRFVLHKAVGDIKYMTFTNASKGQDNAWVQKLNLYSCTKAPTIDKLLKKFLQLADKYIKEYRVDDGIDEISTLSTRELSYHREKTRISKIADKSTGSTLSTFSGKTKRLFDSKKVIDVIKNEYMALWRYLEGNGFGSIDVIDNSIFTWKIKLGNFKSSHLKQALNEIDRKYNYNHVEILISFDHICHPNSPPTIKVLRPRMMNSLMHRISNTKMLNLDYWNPTTGVVDIVSRVYGILEKHAKILINTGLNDISKNPFGAFMPIEDILMDLSALVDSGDTDEIDKDMIFTKMSEVIKPTSTTTKGKELWKSGTGYGHSGAQQWNPDEYTKLQEERNEKIVKVFGRIISSIQGQEKDQDVLYKSLKGSVLIKYLKQQLKSTSLLDMQKNMETYKLYFHLIQEMINENGIIVFHDKKESESLYKIVMDLSDECGTALQLDDSNEIAMVVFGIGTMLGPLYEAFRPKLEEDSGDIDKELCEDSEEMKEDGKEFDIDDLKELSKEEQFKMETKLNEQYKKKMQPYQFSYSKIKDATFYYTKDGKTSVSASAMNKCLKRLSAEIPTLKKSLPISRGSSIFISVDKSRPYMQRYMITGPKDTPYENGCFIFDAYMASTYPTKPPEFRLRNTGGDRFNPNLYACGKVCLSILNTYIGPTPHKSELWIPKESTLYQVVMSIVGQIMIEEPYFNEPGHERSIGSASGKNSSKSYNFNIRYYTMKSAIHALLEDPESYPEFSEAIKAHFREKKKEVIATCTKWYEDSKTFSTSSYSYGINQKTIKDEYETIYQKVLKALEDNDM